MYVMNGADSVIEYITTIQSTFNHMNSTIYFKVFHKIVWNSFEILACKNNWKYICIAMLCVIIQ